MRFFSFFSLFSVAFYFFLIKHSLLSACLIIEELSCSHISYSKFTTAMFSHESFSTFVLAGTFFVFALCSCSHDNRSEPYLYALGGFDFKVLDPNANNDALKNNLIHKTKELYH